MATGAQQTSDNTPATGRGGTPAVEPDDRRYALTAGPVMDLQRPGGLPGSTTGGVGDPGRQGTIGLGVDLQAIAPHTGF